MDYFVYLLACFFNFMDYFVHLLFYGLFCLAISFLSYGLFCLTISAFYTMDYFV